MKRLEPKVHDSEIYHGLAEKGRCCHLSNKVWEQVKELLPLRKPHPLGCHNQRASDRINRFRDLLIRWPKKATHYVASIHLICGLIVWRAAGLLIWILSRGDVALRIEQDVDGFACRVRGR